MYISFQNSLLVLLIISKLSYLSCLLVRFKCEGTDKHSLHQIICDIVLKFFWSYYWSLSIIIALKLYFHYHYRFIKGFRQALRICMVLLSEDISSIWRNWCFLNSAIIIVVEFFWNLNENFNPVGMKINCFANMGCNFVTFKDKLTETLKVNAEII